MARDYTPKAEATIRAEVRELRAMLNAGNLSKQDEMIAFGAHVALAWARGEDVARPSAHVRTGVTRTAASRQPGRAGADRGS